VNHQVQQLLHLGLEAVGLGCSVFGHWVYSWVNGLWGSRRSRKNKTSGENGVALGKINLLART